MTMTTTAKTMTGPVHVGLPAPDPPPVAGCGVCLALGRQRETARRVGDHSTASDASVEIRNHPHGERP